MTNMIRKARVSLSIGEIHETYKLLESMRVTAEGEVSQQLNPFLDSMRVTLKRKLMEEEEGLLGTAFVVRAEPKPRKNSMEGLGFDSSSTVPDVLDSESFMASLAAKVAAAKSAGSEGKSNE